MRRVEELNDRKESEYYYTCMIEKMNVIRIILVSIIGNGNAEESE